MTNNNLPRIDAAITPVSGLQMTFGEAWDFLVGKTPLPANSNKASYQRLCESVLVAAINQFEMSRSGKLAIQIDPLLECTKTDHRAPQDNQTPIPGGSSPEICP